MLLSSLCFYDHASSTSFCPPVSSIDHAKVDVADPVTIFGGEVQTPFSTVSHWWKVNGAQQLSPLVRRDSPSSVWDPVKTPYPSVKRSNASFAYKSAAHGSVTVPDPYNWLEQSVSNSSDVKAFVDAQNVLASKYFDQCPSVKSNKETLKKLYDQPYYSPPSSHGPKSNLAYSFWHANSPDEARSYFVATPDELLTAEKQNWASPPGKKFFDPAALRDGTSLSGDFFWSFNGALTSYAISSVDSSTLTVYFRNASSPWTSPSVNNSAAADEGGPDRLADVLKNVISYQGTWTPDDGGVLYVTSLADQGGKESNGDAVTGSALMFHRLGTAQAQDIRVLELDGQAPSSCNDIKTDNSKWIVVQCSIDSSFAPKSTSYAASLDQPISAEMNWTPIVSEFAHSSLFVTYVGNDFYYITNNDAPFWKAVRTRLDPSKAKPAKRLSDLQGESVFADLIPERKGYVLAAIQFVKDDKFLVVYLKDVYQQLMQFDIQTGQSSMQLLPDHLGSFLTINTRTVTNEAFLTVAGVTTPTSIKRLTWQDGEKSAQEQPTITDDRTGQVQGLDLRVLETREVFITSTDGVQLPTLLMYRKDTPVDGTAPAWILVIGGFRYTTNPTFDPSFSWWVETFGGVLLVASVRGGMEYGEEWHLDGALKKKRNTFIDTIAIAQYLADQKIAAKGKISVIGGQVGGLTALAVANMAPEGLFGAIFSVGALGDMLRYQRFGAGPSWIGEFGDPSDPTFFDILYGYSPLHNVNASKAYPFMLLTASTADSATPPLHSFKVISELQHSLAQNPSPLLMSTKSEAQEDGLIWCLLERVLNLKRLS